MGRFMESTKKWPESHSIISSYRIVVNVGWMRFSHYAEESEIHRLVPTRANAITASVPNVRNSTKFLGSGSR